MQKIRFRKTHAAVWLLSAFALTLHPCRAAAQSQQLFFMVPELEGCSLRLYDPNRHELRAYLQTSHCPTHVIWDYFHLTTTYSVEGELYVSPWAKKSKAKHLGKLGKADRLWISQETGRLRKIRLEPAEEQTLEPGDGKQFWTYQEHRYMISPFPTVGIPHIAILEELDAKKDWQVLMVAATATGVADTPGWAVFPTGKQPKTISIQELLENTTCSRQNCQSERYQVPGEMEDRLRHLLGLPTHEDEGLGLAYLSLDLEYGVLFTTGMDDVVHAHPPIYLCRNQCMEITEERAPKGIDRISISVQGRHFLVTEELTGNGPLLYDWSKGESVFEASDAQRAVWLPSHWLWPVSRPL